MDIVPITLWREARSEGQDGMTAVLHVILNRSADKRWSSDPEKVCLQGYQFSCWNSNDPQRNKYPASADPLYLLAQALVKQPGPDVTRGATAYYDISISAPSWATLGNYKCTVGRLKFHAL
jgi:N-acetylmuramoyl-L-alanine amidase